MTVSTLPALQSQPLATTTVDPEAPGLAIVSARKQFGGGRRFFRMPRRKSEARKPVVAVDNVSFEVARGEIFGVLGPNGTGKSTLIRLISTLLTPDSGTISVFGLDVERDEAAVKRLINRVSVEASFFKKLSPMENLMYAARLYGLESSGARRDIINILGKLGIQKRSIWAPMEDMSRGMQQKVAIARAFLTSPVLLLLDEPTTGLDPHSKRDVQAFIRGMRRDHDTTVLLTTHDMDEADGLCDRIAIFDEGHIVALDTPEGLKATVSQRLGRTVGLEDVFLELTGKSLENEEEKLD
jgi:ABC-2 type transport system ATP-binding protein